MNTYAGFRDFLGDKKERPLRYATRVHLDGKDIKIRHHETDIITFVPDGSVILDTGGWHTRTTKDRLNDYTPFNVYQERCLWYVVISEKTYHFSDGMKIGSTGKVSGAEERSKAKDRESQKLALKANRYVDNFIRELLKGNVSTPSAGDCWYCAMREVKTSAPLGEVTKDGSHILGHMEEKYFVPSLLVRAIDVFPVSHYALRVLSEIWQGRIPESDFETSIVRNQVRSSLRRYVRRQLGMAS